MKADLSRLTFDPAKHTSGVVMQQGRVQLDADWNEQRAIQQYRDETVTTDVIGPTGVPKPDADGGFLITPTSDGKDLTISPGRMYVDGIVCEATPSEIPVISLAGGATVTVAARVLDGHELEAGQIIELLSTVHSMSHAQRRITNVSQPDAKKQHYQLTLDSALPAYPAGTQLRLRRVITYTTQPDYFRTLANDVTSPGRYRAILDVWERHITAIEDTDIREVALGGADTATRMQTVWQVKLERIGNQGSGDCDTPKPSHPVMGQLRARVEPPDPETGDPFCILPPGAGYQGLENQLYRVEIHGGGKPGDGSTRFKWQRDNGSIVTTFEKLQPELILRDLGRDETLGFRKGDRVEITDDHRETGDLADLDELNTSTRRVKLSTGAPTDESLHPKLRRWDGDAEIKLADTWLDLERGLQVQFSAGTYKAGDYWLIPARTATTDAGGDIEWPRDDEGDSLWQPPHGVVHHTAALAVVDYDGSIFVTPVSGAIIDCRVPFPSLTTIEAVDVGFTDTPCKLNATNVQEAIDALCARSGETCTHVATPGDGWETVFTQVADGADARICFPVGDYTVKAPVEIRNKGHITLTGAGPGTHVSIEAAESVLRFADCASVHIRDMSIASGVAATSRERSSHNGALHFTDCRDVTVDSVRLQTAPVPQTETTCLTIEALRKENAYPRVEARVRHSNLEVGERQIGMLLLNVARAEVSDNVIRVRQERFSDKTSDWMASETVRGWARRILIARADIEPEPREEGTNVTLQHGDSFVHFVTPQALVEPWHAVHESFPPPDGVTPQGLLTHIRRTIDEFLRESDTSDLADIFRKWLRDELAVNPATAVQGITVGGTFAPETRIHDNTIEGVIQGIHIGLSRSVPLDEPDVAGRVMVENNTIDVVLPRLGLRERHGIFLGNCASAHIDRNSVAVRQPAAEKKIRAKIDGIRVVGHLGRRVIVRENMLEGCTTGVRFHPVVEPDLAESGRLPAMQWLVADNTMPGAARIVDGMHPPDMPDLHPNVLALINDLNNIA